MRSVWRGEDVVMIGDASKEEVVMEEMGGMRDGGDCVQPCIHIYTREA